MSHPLNKSDMRFMRWMATRVGAFGTTVPRISTVIGRLSKWGYIERDNKRVALSGLGWKALIDHGYPVEDANGSSRT